MATMNVSLPDPLKDWIEAQVKTGRYANVSDYVRDLIRRDQDAKHSLVDALETGASSGFSERSVESIWRAVKKKAARPKV
jgi:antitoxin ParD1/3/4